jgi:hypothetical protein
MIKFKDPKLYKKIKKKYEKLSLEYPVEQMRDIVGHPL